MFKRAKNPGRGMFQSVFFKATGIVLVCTALVSLSLGGLNYRNSAERVLKEAHDHINAIAPLVGRQISGALRFGKPDQATEALTALIDQSDGEGLRALALSADGTELTHVGNGGNPSELSALAAKALATGETQHTPDQLSVAVPVSVGNATVGVLAVEWSADAGFAELRASFVITMLITGAVFLSALLLAAWAFSRLIARPLTRVSSAMSQIASGDYDTIVPADTRKDEIGEIARSLEAFRESLARSEEANRAAMIRGAALTAGSTAILLTDNDHQVTFANEAVEKLLARHVAALRETNPAFDPKTLVGTRADKILASGRQAQSALDGGKRDGMTIEQELSSGAIVVNINPVLDAFGNKIGHVSEWHDVTVARHDAAVLETIDSAQARAEFSCEGLLVAANDKFCDLFGKPFSALEGHDFSRLISQGELRGRAVFDHLNAGEGISGRMEFDLNNGAKAFLDGACGPLKNREGEVLMVVLLGTDVTAAVQEVTRAEATRARDQANQRQVVEKLSDALAALSSGDLSRQIDAAFPDEYEALRADFNRALMTLQAAIRIVVENAELIQAETNQISSASDDLARRGEQQAATLEQTAAALNELTSSVHSAAEGAAGANEMVAHAKTNAEASGKVVREAVHAMGEIAESSTKISRITSVIDDIAFQTNLLALNAGVEAARAGDAGRGFAVVASEVRALAQRSSEAAREIASLISSSTEQVQRGVGLVGQAGDALGGIQSAVEEIYVRVSEITRSTQEQSSGLTEINTAVHQLDQVTQQNSAMFEETNAASQSLKRQANALGEATAQFRLGGEPRQAEIAHVEPAPAARDTRPAAHAPVPAMRTTSSAAVAPAAEDDSWEDF